MSMGSQAQSNSNIRVAVPERDMMFRRGSNSLAGGSIYSRRMQDSESDDEEE